jgi:hypothetical protein
MYWFTGTAVDEHLAEKQAPVTIRSQTASPGTARSRASCTPSIGEADNTVSLLQLHYSFMTVRICISLSISGGWYLSSKINIFVNTLAYAIGPLKGIGLAGRPRRGRLGCMNLPTSTDKNIDTAGVIDQ